jgi:hypothetical protein
MALHRFAIVIDQDVAGTITVDDQSAVETSQRMLAALQSDPKIIPVPSGELVDYGWLWDGTNFIPPKA